MEVDTSAAKEEEEEEEEVILMVELSGLPSVDMIKTCNGTCAVLGLETPEPILQLDNYFFQGTYEDIVGTAMIFKEEGNKLNYLCKTEKKLAMKRVVLKNKQPPTAVVTKDTSAPKTNSSSSPPSSSH